jgi:aerobic carbon-monoxide dehydrogenase medium subunit
VIPAQFDYTVAESVEHATELLESHGGDAKVLAGGQSLLPLLKLRVADVPVLVDIGRLSDLSYVRQDGDRIAIGALTRYSELEQDGTFAFACPLLHKACSEVGDPQVRHMGTIGGACAHGDPASDVPTALLALDGELVTSAGRTIAARDFFTGVFQTALEPTEVLTEIRVPRTSGGWAYEKFHPRAQDWAIVGVAAVVDGSSARIAITGVALTPTRAEAAERAFSGGNAAEAAEHAADGLTPPGDAAGSSEYRAHLARVLTRRALEAAAG